MYNNLDCANVSFKLFTLMTKESKTKWKCLECVCKLPRKDNTNTPIRQQESRTDPIELCDDNEDDSQRNVTLRKKQTNFMNTIELLEEAQFELSTNSPPDFSGNDVEVLKNQIYKLQKELKSARESINQLSIENTNLKTTINDLQQKQNRQIKKQADNYDNKLQNQENTSNGINNEIKDHFTTLTDNKENDNTCKHSYKKKQICIISCDKNNKILKYSEQFFPNVKVCHYLHTNADISSSLIGIDSKLKDFTYNDYCIIFLSEIDFMTTEDYTKLIKTIRVELLKVQHTNVILCLPTYRYKCHANLFNKRVEVFNNMLYLDNETHQYAYILDTNK